MNRQEVEQAIKFFQEYPSSFEWMKIHEDVALEALQAQLNDGCEYCKGKRKLYQESRNTKLYIDTFGKHRILLTETKAHLNNADCIMNDTNINSAFIIKHCPNCGRKLEEAHP